jgi:DNA-binding GntR family transcriptional regulator
VGRTQTSIAIERLRSDIVSGRLRPGEKLRVVRLAEHIGVSASALREALSRLVTDDLVEVEDQRGFRVSPVSRDDLLDLTETRVGIECLALTRAIEHGGVAWEAEIISACYRLSRCAAAIGGDATPVASWSDLHREFHRSLIAACRSEWLLYFCSVLYEQTERYRLLSMYRAPSSREPLKEHEELMAVVIRRDTAAATGLLAAHFRETTRIILASADGLDTSVPSSAGPD